MNFAVGMLIGQLLGWMVRKLMYFWWIGVGLIGGSVVGQVLFRVGVPQRIIIPVTWITAAFIMVYLRKRIKEKREVQMPVMPGQYRE